MGNDSNYGHLGHKALTVLKCISFFVQYSWLVTMGLPSAQQPRIPQKAGNAFHFQARNYGSEWSEPVKNLHEVTLHTRTCCHVHLYLGIQAIIINF